MNDSAHAELLMPPPVRVRTLSVIGLGLIGGSVGLTALERGAAERVIGFDSSARAAAAALERGAISASAGSAPEAVADADLVLLAVPVGRIPALVGQVAGLLKPDCVVTDVGSTKAGLVEAVMPLMPDRTHFVGGHPLAGSERAGIEAASAELFSGCVWILTPTAATDTDSYGRLMRFLTALGARVLALDPVRHDEALALTSHLPQLLSSLLMGFAAEVAGTRAGPPLLAAGGFRDMTRIAASSPDIWVDIVRENRPALLNLLRRFGATLEQATAALEERNWGQLERTLSEARAARIGLLAKPGLETLELSEVRVPVPDRPGVLAEVATTVGEAGINIEDLSIVHGAAGGRGVIHLSIGGSPDAARAAGALRANGFEAEFEPGPSRG